MGFNFSFFGKQEVRRFNYRPRFYDPEAEERRQKYGDFTKSTDKKEAYAPGQHVKGSLRDGSYSRTTDMSKNQKAFGLVSMLLMFTILVLLVWFFSKYWAETEEKEKAKVENQGEASGEYVNEDEYQIVDCRP